MKQQCESNILATAALLFAVLSILLLIIMRNYISLILCPLLGILAIIFGICGIVRAFKVKKGMPMATGGLIIGLIFLTLIHQLIIPMSLRARDLARHAMSQTTLLHIGKAIILYQDEYDDKLPPNMEILIKKGYITEKDLVRPESDDTVYLADGKLAGNPSYVIFLDFPEYPSSSMIMGYEKIKYAYNGQVAVLTLGGGVGSYSIEYLNEKLAEENRPPVE